MNRVSHIVSYIGFKFQSQAKTWPSVNNLSKMFLAWFTFWSISMHKLHKKVLEPSSLPLIYLQYPHVLKVYFSMHLITLQYLYSLNLNSCKRNIWDQVNNIAWAVFDWIFLLFLSIIYNVLNLDSKIISYIILI